MHPRVTFVMASKQEVQASGAVLDTYATATHVSLDGGPGDRNASGSSQQ
jgi:hypothetical protein